MPPWATAIRLRSRISWYRRRSAAAARWIWPRTFARDWRVAIQVCEHAWECRMRSPSAVSATRRSRCKFRARTRPWSTRLRSASRAPFAAYLARWGSTTPTTMSRHRSAPELTGPEPRTWASRRATPAPPCEPPWTGSPPAPPSIVSRAPGRFPFESSPPTRTHSRSAI